MLYKATSLEAPKSREISVAGKPFGGGAPVWVESMTKTPTSDVSATLKQLEALALAGCELVRVALPSEEESASFRRIVAESPLPIVADVHFNYKLAVYACESRCVGVRINPGNIGGEDKLRQVVKSAKDNGCHLRLGANSGSLSKELLNKYGGASAEALLESIRQRISSLKDWDFNDVVVSIKSTHIPVTVQANRLFREEFDYPLHIGITEAGYGIGGIVRSAVGVGLLLTEGLGDSLRVSLSASPLEEVRVGYEILKALELRRRGIELISCPTCGRCQADIISFAGKVEQALADISLPLRVAVMGCEVNGPGEAREAQVGIAYGKKEGLLFCQGEVTAKLPNEKLVGALVEKAKRMAENGEEWERVHHMESEDDCD